MLVAQLIGGPADTSKVTVSSRVPMLFLPLSSIGITQAVKANRTEEYIGMLLKLTAIYELYDDCPLKYVYKGVQK